MMADDIAVMYAGRIVEYGPATEVLSRPAHPYTQGLIEANEIPEKGERLYSIPGHPPDLSMPAAGCAFADRCRYVQEQCCLEDPVEQRFSESQWSACFYAGNFHDKSSVEEQTARIG
jgi:oligopeptide/dipeptide ABC transporter ATP-binding protein